MASLKVQSSNIDFIDYDQDEEYLTIQFNNGRTYGYFGVPANAVLDMLFSESIGKFFNQEIRDFYETEEI